ncbi:MAG TPA: tyrosine--tRNA ligase [Alphaproteobacteria bacterium]|nr:tyrosine--tRNA ligase [Alphaproteobacteria bacterium]HNS44538.1 tyrosine--tRNA ligase [Alphaproteobacteria bacterium]
MTQYKSDFLNIVAERGFIHQCSNFEGLDALLASGPQSAYCGYDPTGKSLHVGHLVSIMMLHWFQQTGNKPYTLVGGATAMIGDPSFKDKTRPLLTKDEINANIESIKQSYSRFIRYGNGPIDASMVNNADWILGLNYMEFLRDYGTCFTINRMMSFDSVKLRLDREQPLTFLEFNYMIMQGYDFYHLYKTKNITIQMGGSDQWGNMINGVDLTHKKIGKEVFVLTVPLITTASGAKMGKTEGGAVWLNADMCSPYDYWQFWRNTEDADVGRFLKLFTTLPMDEIAKLESLKDAEINEAKKILAFEATKLCHGEAAANEAAETARKTFEQGGAGDNLPSITVPEDILKAGMTVIDALRETGLVESNGEAKRLIQGGGAKVNDASISDGAQLITVSDLTGNGYIKLSAGKKKHALIKLRS